uniref:ribonuclease E n=1 Tax=Pulvinaster venetus TaxID=427767 RepID=UPI001FCD5737|nr:ribonuclease E [Pulvinaster venetus]UNJ17049.1 ribonuclease E [Pulvinaster venetus]
MKKKIILSDLYNIAAIILDNKIQEFLFANTKHQVNNIYIGVVNKVFPSINAAFVDIDHVSKSGFIHFSDLNNIRRRYNNINLPNDLITNILTNEQKLLVQIIKESTANKGPRLTTNISLIGRYIILMPFNKNISISRRIQNAHERHYLKSLGILIKPVAMGLSFRSSIVGVSEDVILAELKYLKKQWLFIQKLAITCTPPKLLYNDYDLSKRIVRDFYENQITTIVLDSKKSFYTIHKYLSFWKCHLKDMKFSVQFCNDTKILLDSHAISYTLFNALKKKVDLPLGGYIIIENLEALTVVDVNSGAFDRSDNSKDTIYKINLNAAKEIAYQLRIRNIAGLIIVDFIDMQSQREQLHLLEYFCKYLSFDSIKSQIVQLSELGLVELTRKRRGKSLHELSEIILDNTYPQNSNFCFVNNDLKIDCNSFLYYLNGNLKFFHLLSKNLKKTAFIEINYSSYKLFTSLLNKNNNLKIFNPRVVYFSLINNIRYF